MHEPSGPDEIAGNYMGGLGYVASFFIVRTVLQVFCISVVWVTGEVCGNVSR
jgi:hypothetical protein